MFHCDSSHEINRHLLLGKKVMTNLDSILKSRDVTLPTKVCLVKAMVFPVVPAILIPACASSSPVFLMMYSAYKLNKQGDNIQHWRTSFPIWNQSVVPRPVLTVASWPAYRFLKRQVKWSGIPISFRIFHSLLWSTQSKGMACCNSWGCKDRHDWATELNWIELNWIPQNVTELVESLNYDNMKLHSWALHKTSIQYDSVHRRRDH